MHSIGVTRALVVALLHLGLSGAASGVGGHIEAISWRLHEVDVSVEIEYESPVQLGDYRRSIRSYVEAEAYPTNYSENVRALLTLELERRLQDKGVDLTELTTSSVPGGAFEKVERAVLHGRPPPLSAYEKDIQGSYQDLPDPLSYLLQELSTLHEEQHHILHHPLTQDASIYLVPGQVLYYDLPALAPPPPQLLPHPLTGINISQSTWPQEHSTSTTLPYPYSVIATTMPSPSSSPSAAAVPSLFPALCPHLTSGSFLLLLLLSPSSSHSHSFPPPCPCPAFTCWPLPQPFTSAPPPYIILQLQPPSPPAHPTTITTEAPHAKLRRRLPSIITSHIHLHTWVPLRCGYQVTGGRKALQQLSEVAASRGFASHTFDDDSIPSPSPSSEEEDISTTSTEGGGGPPLPFRAGDLVFTSEHPSGDSLVKPVAEAGARLMRWVLAWEREEDLLAMARAGAVLIPVNRHTLKALPFSSPLWSVLAPPMGEEDYVQYYDGPPLLYKRRLVVWDNDYTNDMASPQEVLPLLPEGTEVVDLKEVKVFKHLMPALLSQARAVVDLSLPGPERLVFEGVLYGAYPVITAHHHGADEDDIPLPSPSLRITALDNASAIASALTPLLTLPISDLSPLFHPLRHATLSLPASFSSTIDHLLSSSALHVMVHLPSSPCPTPLLLPLLLSLLYHYPLARLTLSFPTTHALSSALESLRPAWALLHTYGYTHHGNEESHHQHQHHHHRGSHPIRMVVSKPRAADGEEEGGGNGPAEIRLVLGVPTTTRQQVAWLFTGPDLLYDVAMHTRQGDEDGVDVKVIYPLLLHGEREGGGRPRWGQEEATVRISVPRLASSSSSSSSSSSATNGSEDRRPRFMVTKQLIGVVVQPQEQPPQPGGVAQEGDVLASLCESGAALLGGRLGATLASMCEWDGWRLMQKEMATAAAAAAAAGTTTHAAL